LQAHPKDVDFLKNQIENYKEMSLIFRNGLTTGKYAMGSSEALGSPCDFIESSLKTEIVDDGRSARSAEELAKLFGDGPKRSDGGASSKRNKFMLFEEDCIVLTSMTDVMNNVTDAIHDRKVPIMCSDLYGVVMYMLGFSEEALIVAFNHLVDKSYGTTVMGMTKSHLVLWLRTFLSKNYYQ